MKNIRHAYLDHVALPDAPRCNTPNANPTLVLVIVKVGDLHKNSTG